MGIGIDFDLFTFLSSKQRPKETLPQSFDSYINREDMCPNADPTDGLKKQGRRQMQRALQEISKLKACGLKFPAGTHIQSGNSAGNWSNHRTPGGD